MIYVCSLDEMPCHVRALRPSHLISVIGAEKMPRTPAPIAPGRHLRLACDDIVAPLEGFVQPETEHVAELIAFARTWERSAPILIHCQAGVSRSTAAALTVGAVCCEGREAEMARRLRAIAPHANPNRRMVALADALLGCRGRLIQAVEAMGMPGYLVPAGAPLIELALD